MADDKEIKIRAVLDASTFDKGIQEIQEKLKKITQQQTAGQGAQRALGKDSVMGKYAQQAFGDFGKDSQRQLEQMYQVQRREAVNQSITMKGKQQELEKMLKTDGMMSKQQKERTENLKKEIDLLKEKHRLTLSTAGETQKAIDKMRGGVGGGPPPTPGSAAPTGGGDGSGGLGAFGGILRTMTAAALLRGGFNAATEAYSNFMVTRPREMIEAKGAAMTGISRDMRENFAGQGSNRAYWAKERAKAFQMSKTERDRQEHLDLIKGGVGAAAGAGIGGYAGMVGGATAGIYAGGAIGSLFGGVGALPGAIIGGAIGGVGGLIGGAALGAYGGSAMVGGEKGRSAIFDREKYKQQSAAEMMKNREQIEAAEIASDPLRAHARDYFMNNYEQMSQFERQTGKRSRAEMYAGGGLLRTQMRMGEKYGGGMLSMEDIMGQTSALQAAGGGTQAAGMSGFAGAVNRQFGITNAAQTMGKLQGMGGLGNEGTQEATRRLLSEAVRLGVDASKMPQEMERMTAMTAQIATAGGGYSTIAAQIAGTGVMGLSAGQIAAAGGAAGEFQTSATETEGVGGQIGWGYMLGEKSEKIMGRTAMRQIRQDPRMMNLFQNLSASDLQKDPGLLKGLAENLNVDEDTVLEFAKGLGAEKQTFSTPEAEAAAAYGESIKGKTPEEISAMQTAPGAEGAKFRAGKLAFLKQRGGTQGKQFLGAGTFGREARMGTIAGAVTEGGTLPELEPAEAAVEATMTEEQKSAAEKEKASKARGQADMIYNLNQNLESFGDAADMSVKNADAINFAMDKLKIGLEKSGGSMNDELEKIATQLEEFSKRMEKAGIPVSKPANK